MQRRLLLIVVACLAVFLATQIIAKMPYPDWMWVFLFAGLVVPPVVAAVALLMLLQHRRSARSPRR